MKILREKINLTSYRDRPKGNHVLNSFVVKYFHADVTKMGFYRRENLLCENRQFWPIWFSVD